MGIMCKIVRNEDNSIQYVEAPNGNESKLFKDLKGLDLSDQEALDAWTVSTTDAFNEDILNPRANKHKTRIFNKLKNLTPKNNKINIIFGNKDVEVDITKLKYKSTSTPTGLTVFAMAEVDGKQEQIGRMSLRKFRDGFRVDSSLLSDLQVYNKGKIESIKGNGIGTQMYKQVAQTLLKGGKILYSDVTSSPEAEGVWNKFQNLGIVDVEITQKGRYYSINPSPKSLDENGEPSAKDVLSYISNSNNENVQGLTSEETVDLREAMLNTDVDSSDKLIQEWDKMFFANGGFEVTKSNLNKSNFYTRAEKEAILNNPELQEQLRQTYAKIKASPIIFNDLFVDRDFLNIKSTAPNIVGKFSTVNPFLLEKEAITKLAGATSREEFEETLLNSDLDYLKEVYYKKQGTVDDVYYKLSDYVTVPVKEIVNDELVDKKANSTEEVLGETITDPSNTELLEDIIYLKNISPEIWNTNPIQIKNLLKEFSRKSIDIGLDTIGIENFYDSKTIEEFSDLFSVIDLFMNNQNTQTFNGLVAIHKEFFGTQDRPAVETLKDVKGKAVYLKTPKSAFELFTKFGLLPTGENLFRRVNKDRPVDDVYESIYLNIVDNPSILPMAAYNMAIDKEGVLNRSILNDLNRKSEVIEGIKSFVRAEVANIDSNGVARDTDMLEKMYLYSSYYNTPVNKIENNPSVENELSVIENYPNDTEYVTGEFVADFYKKYLREKFKKSKVFSDFYSNFAITNRGIRMINTDPLTMERMNIGLESQPKLRDHLLLQKDSQITANGVEENFILEDDTLMRNYYANFPSALNKFVGNYSTIDNNTILAKIPNNFVRIDKGVFEMVDSYGDYSVFKRIEPNPSNYKAYSKEFTKPVNKLDLSSYGITTSNEGAEVTLNNKYSSSQETNIDNQIDNCS